MITRKKITTKTFDDGGEGLWAVSYADLLMVMMSFFIVFFNLEQESDEKSSSAKKYFNIVVSLAEDEILKKDTNSGKVYKTVVENKSQDKNFFSEGFSSDATLPKILFKEVSVMKGEHLYFSDLIEIEEFKVKSTGTGERVDNVGLIIDFSNDIFELGSHEFSEKAKKELSKVLSSQEEEDSGLDSDVSYITPLAIHHINNVELTKIVLKEFHLFPRLSQLRVKNLNNTIEEKIQIMSESKLFGSKTDLDLSKYPPSITRKINTLRTLEITSIEEEEKLLLKKDLGVDLKEAIPSLAWMLELEESQIKITLGGYNAKELAEAWIAPNYVLERLSSYLTEKKKALLENYLQKITPSRRSITFKARHQTTIKELRLKQVEQPREKKLNAVS